jgi:hypothetical protein
LGCFDQEKAGNPAPFFVDEKVWAATPTNNFFSQDFSHFIGSQHASAQKRCLSTVFAFQCHVNLSSSEPGLPDGLFLYQKPQFGYILEGLRMANVLHIL